MNPQLVSAQDEHRAPSVPFRVREFRRVIAMVRPYRGRLIMGLLFTVAFATLHTVSVSGAFPVFKILLETEGLNGWVNRVVAGERLGVEFGPLTDPDVVRVLRVQGGVRADGGPLQEGLELRDARGRPASVLLHELATIETGKSVAVQLSKSGDVPSVTLSPGMPDRPVRLLAWAASKIPVDTNERKLATLAYVLAALAVIAIASNVFRYFGEIWIAEAVLRGMMDLRDVLYERTLRLPMNFFSSRPIADIVTRFVQDIQEVQRGLITLFGKFIREPMRAIFLLTTALLLDWRITLIAALAAPVAIAIFWAVGRAVKAANMKLLQAYGMMIGALTTSLQNLRVVKAYTAEDQERQRLDVVDRSMFKQQLKLARLDAFVGPMMETIAVLGGGFLSLWLLNRVVNHELSLAKFATLGVALSVLFDPLRKLSDVWVRIQRSVAAAERIFHVVDEPVEGDETRGGAQLAPLESGIEFTHVTFTYPGAEQAALRDVSLTIRQGETVAIVGPNGSGKTTLVSLLLRLFEPDAGEIRYDGMNIRKADLQSLRRRIGMVTQDAIVFAGTPVENITYGAAKHQNAETSKRRNDEIVGQSDDNSGASPNGRVEEAARRAFADEFIRQIPGGYAASLGERGTTLSGGQRQRLAIARAVYRDAPILVFDEATSQIDSESELKIQTALKEFSVGRTTLIIAHRLSTIQFAGRIVVMESGRIIDEGTHAELFNRCALYRTLCETQFVGEVHA